MAPQCQLFGHEYKLTLAAAIWLTGAMLDFAIVMREHAVLWPPYKTYLLISEACFLCPGLVASAGTVTEFKCVYHGRQYDAVYRVYLFHICCDSGLTTQHIRNIQSITLYRWPEVVVYASGL